jgi:urease accessory protein
VTLLDTVRSLQFGDSALPVGAFSFSSGLEAAVAAGVVTDAATLEEFVGTARRQATTGDAIAVLAAHRAARMDDLAGVVDADEAVLLRKLNDEARNATSRMGRKLAELAAPLVDAPIVTKWLDAVGEGATPGTYPAGIGIVLAAAGTDERDAFAVHQYGVSATILGAALRILRVDHHDTQAIAFRVNEAIGDEYAAASTATLDDMSTYAPVTDVLAALHVHAHVRMFMS